MIRLILVDDHIIFRDGLKSLLEKEEIAEIIGEASNGQEFLDTLHDRDPDLVLMDIDMPLMNGIEATSKAVQIRPDLKILVLSMYGEEEYYYEMIEAGARGFILKSSGATELKNAIHKVVHGESYFSNELLRRIIMNIGQNKNQDPKRNRIKILSQRENEVLQEICNGSSNNEIAEKLHISPKTVKGHRTNLLAKTECKNTAALVMYAITNKLVEVS